MTKNEFIQTLHNIKVVDLIEAIYSFYGRMHVLNHPKDLAVWGNEIKTNLEDLGLEIKVDLDQFVVVLKN